jgi:hypothetical protein
MKAADRLAKLETANLPALRLADVQSFPQADGDFLASVLCGLAMLGATLPACDELRAMSDRHSATMAAIPAAELEAMPTPDGARDWPDGYVMAVILWDVFQWMPTAWRTPGAEARLLTEFPDVCESLAGKSKDEIREQLNRELKHLPKENP